MLVFSPHSKKIVVDGTTTCLKTVVGVRKGMIPVRYLCSMKPLFVSVEFTGDHKTVCIDDVKYGHPQFFYITGLKIVASVCMFIFLA